MACNNIFKSLNTVKSRSFFFKLCSRKDQKEKVLRIIPSSRTFVLELKSTARLLPCWAVRGLKIHEPGQNISNKFSIWQDSASE